MHYSIAEEICIFKAGDHSENSSLLGEGEMSLEAYDIEHSSLLVFTAKLNYCIVSLSRFGVVDTSCCSAK